LIYFAFYAKIRAVAGAFPFLISISCIAVQEEPMKRDVRSKILLVLVLMMFVLIGSGAAQAANSASNQIQLSPADCAKCHMSQAADIEANGSKHKTSVNCQDCHASHRPASKNNIPACSQCHQGKPHYEQKNCLQCHKNPHTPLKVTFDKPMTEPCLACHTNQIKQLQENKSKHSAKNCTDCHDVHRKIPQCTQCHKSHSADITAADCKKCHKAHMPKVVTYASDVPSNYCGACHRTQLETLTTNKTKHSTQSCAACHQEKHKMMPKCQDCHGEKHPAGIMSKFPKCLECHKSPHDLNNWTAPASAPAPKAESPKKKAKKP
jgi:hypothetical protein